MLIGYAKRMNGFRVLVALETQLSRKRKNTSCLSPVACSGGPNGTTERAKNKYYYSILFDFDGQIDETWTDVDINTCKRYKVSTHDIPTGRPPPTVTFSEFCCWSLPITHLTYYSRAKRQNVSTIYLPDRSPPTLIFSEFCCGPLVDMHLVHYYCTAASFRPLLS